MCERGTVCERGSVCGRFLEPLAPFPSWLFALRERHEYRERIDQVSNQLHEGYQASLSLSLSLSLVRPPSLCFSLSLSHTHTPVHDRSSQQSAPRGVPILFSNPSPFCLSPSAPPLLTSGRKGLFEASLSLKLIFEVALSLKLVAAAASPVNTTAHLRSTCQDTSTYLLRTRWE